MLLGPTGTGKSALALALAERLPAEIVSCDAYQVYRGLDIGTAKVDRETRARVPHHLVDCLDPREAMTMGAWVRRAEAAIAEIAARGRVPLLVGGTGLYLRALLRGMVRVPPTDARLRGRLRAMAARFGAPRLHRWLASVDPASAARLARADTQRIVRALEIALQDRRTWSERLAEEGSWSQGKERYPALKIGLDMEAGLLAQRLAARVEAFFCRGWVAEVEKLLAAGVPLEANAFQAIGYREIAQALARRLPPESAREVIVRRTRHYAKRQRTWFRREPGVVWLDAACDPQRLARTVLAHWEAFANAPREPGPSR